jgi:glycosylphosphatidylinositol transamidase
MPSNPTHMLKLGLQRTTSYIDHLPIFTKVVMCIMVAIEAAALLPGWRLKSWGRLEPDLVNFSTLYRTNTYPLMHIDAFHLTINFLGVVPLLERFEKEHGTLISVALFFGPFSTVPALMYVVIERGLLGANTPILGSR